MTPDEREAFLAEHRFCIVGFGRKDGPPALSPVYYAMDGKDIVISTTLTRAKAKAVRRDPQVSLCVPGEAPPFPYLPVYGRARIEPAGAVDLMMKIGERMSGNPVPESARPAVQERADKEQRIVFRVTPESFVP